MVLGLAPSSQANQTQTAASADRDAVLARYFDVYSTGFSIEQRIQQQSQAVGKSAEAIEITKSLESEFQQHVPSSKLGGVSPLILSEVANSDLIVMGTPLDARTLPIEDRSFLFTEYSVRVERVFSNDRHGILPGDTIVIARGGGQLTVQGFVVKAVEPAFDEFRLNQRYIFMLRAIPNSDAYRALGSGTFAVDNEIVSTTSHLEERKSPRRKLDDFLSELDLAVARKHSRKN